MCTHITWCMLSSPPPHAVYTKKKKFYSNISWNKQNIILTWRVYRDFPAVNNIIGNIIYWVCRNIPMHIENGLRTQFIIGLFGVRRRKHRLGMNWEGFSLHTKFARRSWHEIFMVQLKLAILIHPIWVVIYLGSFGCMYFMIM